MRLAVRTAASLWGEITVPGDKSISHRAALIGALARGTTEISNFLPGDDCRRTVDCLQRLGVQIEQPDATTLVVHGQGPEGLSEPADILGAGNSGTTLRLLLGVLAGQPFFSVLTGDASLRQRPMARVTEPLRSMGATILGRGQGGCAPLAIRGGELRPIDYTLPVASAQVKSALLLAGLAVNGTTRVTEPAPTRDHTEIMLRSFGAEVRREGATITLTGRPTLTGQRLPVPGDLSSAAFFLAAGAAIPGSALRISGAGVNPTRTGIIDVLRAMGADLTVENVRTAGGESVADLCVRGSELRGTEIAGALIPRLIDEIPALAVAAAAARGETVIRDAAELRVKESDRIGALAHQLRRLGAEICELPDGLVIRGGAPLHGALVHSGGDHRMAMALALAGLLADGETVVEDAGCIAVSFPGFAQMLEQVSRR